MQVTPAALPLIVCLIDTPGLVRRLKKMAQAAIQFWAVALHPPPDYRVVRIHTALSKRLFHLTERERVAKIPAHGTKNELRRRLPPLEDRRANCLLHGHFRLPAPPDEVATHPCAEASNLHQARISRAYTPFQGDWFRPGFQYSGLARVQALSEARKMSRNFAEYAPDLSLDGRGPWRCLAAAFSK